MSDLLQKGSDTSIQNRKSRWLAKVQSKWKACGNGEGSSEKSYNTSSEIDSDGDVIDNHDLDLMDENYRKNFLNRFNTIFWSSGRVVIKLISSVRFAIFLYSSRGVSRTSNFSEAQNWRNKKQDKK